MRILLAEDERDLNAIIKQKLTADGYSVDSCYDGKEAMELLDMAEYDAVILDIMMPKADGWQVLAHLRNAGKVTPVLFLTARDSIADRVRGLDSGANDYQNGKLFYEITLVKGTKKYDITYRASNGRLVKYGWEEREQTGNNTNIISKSACKKLAKSKVKKAKIQSVSKKYDDGIYVYVVKMKKGSKKYTLEYAAGTGKLLEYEWKLVSKTSSSTYIGTTKAKKIALAQVTGATLVKIEFDKDDGVPVYEAELTKGQYEYEITIHAKTGKVLEIDKDLND